MIILLVFAFIAGFVTILSPCILPILPIVLSGSLTGGKSRPLGVIVGFILSFTFFATFSFALAKALGIKTDILRNIAVIFLVFFGASLFFPQFQVWTEKLMSKLPLGKIGQNKNGFSGGVLIGLSLGIVWTPCVGPILASVLTIAASSAVTLDLILITFAYSLGTAIPLFAITYGGKRVLDRLPGLRANSAKIQKAFGILIFATALIIFFNYDRKFQAFILEKFPNYGTGLTQFEENDAVKEQLNILEDNMDDSAPSRSRDRSDEGWLEDHEKYLAPSRMFLGAGPWINSDPLTLDELSGKVVLIDFWTYSCINCIRTFPHITSWYEKYKDNGFVLIGVHTPEFAFERETENVEQAADDFGLTYPIVQDNNYQVWRDYKNRYWPAHYLIDKDGFVRYIHFGEGKYEETEEAIRTLLVEAGYEPDDKMSDLPDMFPTYRTTPESYLGYQRIARFASPEEIVPDARAEYTIPTGLNTHELAYGGVWDVSNSHAHAEKDAELKLRFEAKEVYLVMLSEVDMAPVEVYLDGELVREAEAGEDVEDGIVEVEKDEERLYRLINLDEVDERELLLKFPEGSIEVFAFTFG